MSASVSLTLSRTILKAMGVLLGTCDNSGDFNHDQTSRVSCGSSGYLGWYVVKAFREGGYAVRVLVRNREKLASKGACFEPAVLDMIEEIIIGNPGDPASMKEAGVGINVVFCCAD